MMGSLNEYAKNMFSTLSTIIYSFIIGFFISANNLRFNHKIFYNVPPYTPYECSSPGAVNTACAAGNAYGRQQDPESLERCHAF